MRSRSSRAVIRSASSLTSVGTLGSSSEAARARRQIAVTDSVVTAMA